MHFDPESVGVANEKGLVTEQRQSLSDTAALIEQAHAFVGNDNLRARARAQVIDGHVGKMMHVDDGRLDASLGKSVEAVVDQRLAAT